MMHFFLWLVASGSVAVHGMDLSARYHASSTYVNTLDMTGAGSVPLVPQMDLLFAGRAGVSRLGLEKIEAAGEAAWSPGELLRLSLRLNHTYYFDEVAASTTLLGAAELRTPEWTKNSYFFVKGGWYRRFLHLNKVTLLPFFRSSFTEHDFAVGLGAQLRMAEQWLVRGEAATFEDMTVYNFNHPYGEIAVLYHPSDSEREWRMFFRYHVVLGFGRLGDLSAGVSVSGI